LIFNKIFKLIL